MKKFASLLLTVVLLAAMLTVFAVPASAEEEPTEIEPEDVSMVLFDSGNYIISSGNYTLFDFGLQNTDATLTIAKGVTLTVTEGFWNMGTINVLGTLNANMSIETANNGIINVVTCSGTLSGIDGGGGIINRADHTLDNNGICTLCGFVDETVHIHDFTTGECVCGKPCPHENWTESVCDVCQFVCTHENWTECVCDVCGYYCPHTNRTTAIVSAEKEYCPNCGIFSLTEIKETDTAGSTISEGNMAIIVGVAAAVVFGLGGFLVGKKNSIHNS